MLSPDLGGGRRLRRRPGSLLTGVLVFFLLFPHPLPSPTPDLMFSGDSDGSIWVRCNASSVFTANPAEAELHRFFYSCLAGSEVSRSKEKTFLSMTSNPRSGPYASFRVSFALASVRLCSPFHISEKSRSLFNLISTPVTGCSKCSHPFNPAGASSFVRCSARQDRYKLPTPIVWNINSKFPVDFGVLHGSNSVMGKSYHFSGIYSRREDLICGCNLPILNRFCNRLCTAFRFNLSSRRTLPTIARTFGSSLAELSTGNMIGLILTGKATSSTPVCSTTVLGHNQSAIPYEEEASKGNGCLLTTLIWEKGLGPKLKVESPIAEVNVVDVSIGFFNCWVCCNVKNWTMDPIKLSV